jgi:hypothetical protein
LTERSDFHALSALSATSLGPFSEKAFCSTFFFGLDNSESFSS